MRLISKKDFWEGASIIKKGGVLVFPTETSYGLGCDASNQEAVSRIFQIKERSSDKALLFVVPDVSQAKKYLVWDETIDKLAKKFWTASTGIFKRFKRIPPLTIVGKYRGDGLAQGVVAADNTVAVRVTSHPWLKKFCQNINCPLVATSANLSGEKEFYNAGEILKFFKEKNFQPDGIVNAGYLRRNLASTVVKATDAKVKILRQGKAEIPDEWLGNSFGQEKRGAGRIKIFVLLGAFFAAVFFLLYFWQMSLLEIENNSRLSSTYAGVRHQAGEKIYLKTVKGVYLTAYSAGNEKKINQIISLIEKTELNAVVIDIKDYSGLILYDSDLPLVNELKTEDDRLGDLKALVEKLHEHGIYVIARQTVFQDPVLAERRQEWATKNKSNGVWRDNKGLAWVDPTRKEVWDYNLAIAKEATDFGFDEINFDYIRFPSDGKMSQVVYTMGDKTKYQVMAEFYRYLSTGLSRQPVWISFDMFGLVMETIDENDMNIGQRLVDAVDNADFICPMMYPSHYPAGHLGLHNPADYPFQVIVNGMEKGVPFFQDKRAKVRPWIQAFDLGAIYDGTKIRAEIEAVEKYTDAGWLLWNASNRYTDAGLK